MGAAKTKTFSRCESSVYIWFLQVLTVLGLTSLAIWASLTPKTPIFTISNVNLEPHQNDTTLPRTSFVALNVTVSNPNKMVGIFFDELNVTIRCKNDTVGAKSVPGFYLGHRSGDLKEVELSVMNNIGADGKVDLRVGLETRVRYKILRFKTRNRRLVFEDYAGNGSDGQMLAATRDMKLS